MRTNAFVLLTVHRMCAILLQHGSFRVSMHLRSVRCIIHVSLMKCIPSGMNKEYVFETSHYPFLVHVPLFNVECIKICIVI